MDYAYKFTQPKKRKVLADLQDLSSFNYYHEFFQLQGKLLWELQTFCSDHQK
jgi:cytochrome c oxidase subunit IV